MVKTFDVAWRTCFTLLSFFLFGLGALILSLVIFPVVHLLHDVDRAQRTCRRLIHYSFRLFIGMMRFTGVLDYRVLGRRSIGPGHLIVGNHPSLIDVIFVVAQVPDAYCVVKEGISRSPFTRLIVRATGYITSATPEATVTRCVELLEAGAIVVMFPEGTRSVEGQPIAFRNGASHVICRSGCPVVPVYLRIHPPTLAKGQAWRKVPASRVQYFIEIGEPMAAETLIQNDTSERLRSRVCTRRLQSHFDDQLEKMKLYGNLVKGYQDSDREYSGA